VLLGALMLLASLGCRPDAAPPEHAGELACTLVGCYSTLTVVVHGVGATDAISLEAHAVGTARRTPHLDSATARASCLGAACAAGMLLEGFAPETVRLVLRRGARSTERVLAPTYAGDYVNGRHCEAACGRGRLEVRADTMWGAPAVAPAAERGVAADVGAAAGAAARHFGVAPRS
jgi:hypothetical protein